MNQSTTNITFPRFLILLLLASLTPSLYAQEPNAGGSTFFESVNVDVVNVEVFVTDRKGNPISNLKREDFRLIVDGAEAPITNFYAQVDGRPVDRGFSGDTTTPLEDTIEPAEVPIEQRLHLVIFIDNLHLRATNRKKTFTHLREFLDDHLNPEDRVTVVSQNNSLFIHNDFMNDRVVLNDILDEVQKMPVHGFAGEATRRRLFQEIGFDRTSIAGGRGADFDQDQALPQIRAYAEREFSLATSSLDSLERLLVTLGGIKGRKAMIHVSDGIANRPGEGLYEAWNDVNFDPSNSYERVIGAFDLLPRFRALGRAANASGVTFYAIDAETDHTSIGRSAALAGGEGGILPSRVIEMIGNNPRETMELTAQTTGGKRLQRTPNLSENLGQLANDFGSFYSLGFQADSSSTRDNHKIEVKVVGKGLRVRHRETYKARPRDDQSGDFAMAALLYNAVDNPLGISLEPGTLQNRDDGTFMLTVLVKIPVKNLVLLPGGTNHSAQLSFFITMKDRAGDPRPVQKIPFHLPIPTDKVEEARAHEAAYPLDLVIRPGDLQAVVSVRDDHASIESAVRMDLDRWAGVPVEKKRRNRTSP